MGFKAAVVFPSMLLLAMQPTFAQESADAVLPSGITCQTTDSQDLGTLKYTCFVHSRQADGRDASDAAIRERLVRHHLSAVCGQSMVLRDELFLSEGEPPVQVWRVMAQCTRDAHQASS